MKIELNIFGEHIDRIEHCLKIDGFNYDFESTFLIAKKTEFVMFGSQT
jgi:hypothetical protein